MNMDTSPSTLADMQPAASDAHPLSTSRDQAQMPAHATCSSGLCSTGLMKSFCPTCLILGLILLPFELAYRSIARLFRKDTHNPYQPDSQP